MVFRAFAGAVPLGEEVLLSLPHAARVSAVVRAATVRAVRRATVRVVVMVDLLVCGGRGQSRLPQRVRPSGQNRRRGLSYVRSTWRTVRSGGPRASCGADGT